MTANEVRHKGSSSVRGRIKEQKAALIQEEILIAAARFSAEMGFTKSIVYYYMKNKNEILWRIFEKIDETYANGLDDALLSGGSVVEQLSKVMGMHCMNVLSHLDWSTIYNRDLNELIDEQRTTVEENRRQYNRRIRSLYEEGVRLGHFRAAPPIIAVSCLIGACNWPYTWFNPKGKLTAEEIAEGYAKQLIHGVLSQG
jgi:TetR/AcrR family transcriptional regulator, cholesterol catabolism regulator